MPARLRPSGSGIELIARPVAFYEDQSGPRIGFALLNLSARHETTGGKRVTISQMTHAGNIVLNVFGNEDGTYGFTIFGGRVHGSSDLGLMLAQMAEDRLHHRLRPIPVDDVPRHESKPPHTGRIRASGSGLD